MRHVRFFVVGALLALGIMGFAVGARGDDPQFGACWANGLCVGPRVAAPAMSIDLKTGDAEFGVLPGFGYGFERVDLKIPWGAAIFVNVVETTLATDPAAVPHRKAVPSLMIDLFRYIHVGVMYPPGGHAYGLLTLGTDLGSAPAPAVPVK